MPTPGGFQLLTSTSVEDALEFPISSNAVTNGDMMELDVGAVAWTDADSSTQHWQLKFVATETVSTSATVVKGTLVSFIGQRWACETANAAATADNGDRMVLSDANTVNNTGTDSTDQTAVVVQLIPMGALTNQRIIGFIVPGTGVDPDAT